MEDETPKDPIHTQSKDLADMYFFKTLVRLHRGGEGEPCTGLKPAGTDLGPVVPMADKAIAAGDVTPLLEHLAEAVRHVRPASRSVPDLPPGGGADAGAAANAVRFLPRPRPAILAAS